MAGRRDRLRVGVLWALVWSRLRAAAGPHAATQAPAPVLWLLDSAIDRLMLWFLCSPLEVQAVCDVARCVLNSVYSVGAQEAGLQDSQVREVVCECARSDIDHLAVCE